MSTKGLPSGFPGWVWFMGRPVPQDVVLTFKEDHLLKYVRRSMPKNAKIICGGWGTKINTHLKCFLFKWQLYHLKLTTEQKRLSLYFSTRNIYLAIPIHFIGIYCTCNTKVMNSEVLKNSSCHSFHDLRQIQGCQHLAVEALAALGTC